MTPVFNGMQMLGSIAKRCIPYIIAIEKRSVSTGTRKALHRQQPTFTDKSRRVGIQSTRHINTTGVRMSNDALGHNAASQWTTLCKEQGFTEKQSRDIWDVIETRYNEPQRYYHTLEHIQALLNLADQYAAQLSDKLVVLLAIYFHDIIYDPKSKTNEEDSAEVFMQLCSSLLDKETCQKVHQYIIETKKHDVGESLDNDLKLFIDFDMSILGQDTATYPEYARNIRKEYEFVPEADYCKGRAAVLTSFLQAGASAGAAPAAEEAVTKKYVFASPLFRELYEEQARRNLAWECEILNAGKLV